MANSEKGNIIFAGIDEYEEEIYFIIIVEINVDICLDYLKTCNGNIIFANVLFIL